MVFLPLLYLSIIKTFDLDDIKFSRIVKMPISVIFQKVGPVAPNLYNIIFDDVI